jgi:hypothetical protein
VAFIILVRQGVKSSTTNAGRMQKRCGKCAGKFKVQNPKFKQTPKFKPMNRMEYELRILSFGLGSLV